LTVKAKRLSLLICLTCKLTFFEVPRSRPPQQRILFWVHVVASLSLSGTPCKNAAHISWFFKSHSWSSEHRAWCKLERDPPKCA